MIKVSVIIPVYNGERYIKRCLDSVLNQTLKEIEVIIINDGSVDNTDKLLEEYQNKYGDKIVVVSNKENLGQGKSRNIGIDTAKGEYLTFVDSDDTIDLDMLQNMYDISKKENADITICDYYEIIDNKKTYKKAIPKKTNDIKKDYIVSIAGPCNKLLRTNMLKENKLYFLEHGIYEDIAVVPLIALYANKISYVEKPFYNYYIRLGSTMRQKEFGEKLLSIYEVMETLEEGFKASGKIEDYKKELEYIYIEHLLYAGIGRFLEYKEGINEVGKIVKIIKEKYPNWRKNPYYKRQSFLFKLNCNIFYTNFRGLILTFQKLKNIAKGQ